MERVNMESSERRGSRNAVVPEAGQFSNELDPDEVPAAPAGPAPWPGPTPTEPFASFNGYRRYERRHKRRAAHPGHRGALAARGSTPRAREAARPQPVWP